MKIGETVKMTMALVLVAGLVVTVGCGGKKEVIPEPTPMAVFTPEPTPEPEPEMQYYMVVPGDTLWGISGMADIYGDHFQWPLIFKANRDQIQDPDLIYTDQEFVISREFTPEEVEMAIENAKRTPRYVPHTQPRMTLPIEY